MKIRTLCATATVALISTSAFANEPYCREFTKTIYVGGRAQQGYGTSCLQPDGSWLITQEATSRPVVVQQEVTYVQPVNWTAVSRPYPRPYGWPFLFSLNIHDHDRHYHHKRHYNHHHEVIHHHARHHGHRKSGGTHVRWHDNGGHRKNVTVSRNYERPNRGDRFNDFY